MRLVKLTLSGFKSFARSTVFEFPAAISGVVGPNGSGKSNVAEAIRWVLGEQSLKTIRGRRGEDLIFNGSPSAARLGKASVGLVFDNRDRALPTDFDEVHLERKIFRDGTNEYYLNGSQVRLRDIVELLARIGLGETKHNIIGQGEVDRALLASPGERRDMFEEAIGLRLYQLRKREAERKLEETSENAAQVASLIREITPHLKFLRSQADKAEKREVFRRELEDYYRAYVQQEAHAVAGAEKRLRADADPAQTKLEGLTREIAVLTNEIEARNSGEAGDLERRESAIAALEDRRRELERELGRIEGRMEGRAARRDATVIPVARIEHTLRPLAKELEVAAEASGLEELRSRVRAVAVNVRRAIAELGAAGGSGGGDLAAERDRIQAALGQLDGELVALRKELATELKGVRTAEAVLRERFERLREKEEEAQTLRVILERSGFEHEKIAARKNEIRRLGEESGLTQDELMSGNQPFAELEPPEIRRQIEKLRARLEEIGGIDDAVIREYRETKVRHEFLERELGDLNAAARDLRALVAELGKQIETEFHLGFSKIKEAFGEYFHIIFGGGEGVLSYQPLRRGERAQEDGEEENLEYGIEIDVDLPRKRVRGLAMLSGGERALVSIALLFAITAVNPPPFLVLDETDAALDEANSRKYGAILKELSAKTQLILITHNRETMQQAGILYGVTMGGDGISKILSLKLEEAKSYSDD